MSKTNVADSALILKAEGLKQHYHVKQGMFKPEAVVKAVDGVSFNLEKGKTLAVVGESGCGKSTLGRMLTMIETPTDGQLGYLGQNLLTLSKSAQTKLRQKIQIIFQNPYGSLNPRKKIGSILEEPLVINTDLSKADRKAKAVSMMEKVGLKAEHYDRYPHMFSGGQRQRIAIARGLMLDPHVIVADEPVSALDVSVQAQVLNLMMDKQEERNLTYLFITHDLAVVEHFATRVAVMYLGRVCELASTKTLFSTPKHPYTRALLSAIPRLDTNMTQPIRLIGEVPTQIEKPIGCVFQARCPYANQRCYETSPKMLRQTDGSSVACHAIAEGRLS